SHLYSGHKTSLLCEVPGCVFRYTFIPVIPVQTGGSATFTCARSNTDLDRGEVHWYKQIVGANLKLIMALLRSTPQFAPEFSTSKWKVNSDHNFSNLTILRTIQEDEGLYHCVIIEWAAKFKCSSTFLIVKGNIMRFCLKTFVASVFLISSVRNEALKNLNILEVFWFRMNVRPILRLSLSPQKCVYNFSKTVTSSDAGTYYCAVATCGQILFGNGAKSDNKGNYQIFFFFLHTGQMILVI
uniref:Ig-like domain-containing protein n=1 Tax=Acanthochromis polyacanthus TaxID=80966 RepID=A0A3Q1ET60_9TELE